MRRFAAGITALALLTGLGANATRSSAATYARPQILRTLKPGWMAQNADPNHAWLYVSGGYDDAGVVAYDLSAPGMPLVETITDGIDYPVGMTIGRDGTLYVANAGGSNPGVYVYPWGQTSPSTYIPTTNPPYDMVLSKNGDLYLDRYNSPDIEIYRPGHHRPSRTVKSGLLKAPTQMIFDHAGNLFVADSQAGVFFMPHGTFEIQSLGLQDLDGCTGGLALDEQRSALFVSDCNGGTQEYTLGDPYPIESLDEAFPADFLGIGYIDHHGQTLFAPSLFTGQVVFYGVRSTTPYATLQTTLSESLGVLYKPAGVPHG